jgi:hypothetical protein
LQALRKIRCFSAIVAIFTAINSPLIRSLEPAWRHLPKAKKILLRNLEYHLKPTDDFSGMRDLMASATSPAVPCLGFVLRELANVESIPTVLTEDTLEGYINVEKLNRAANALRPFIKFQASAEKYQFFEIPELLAKLYHLESADLIAMKELNVPEAVAAGSSDGSTDSKLVSGNSLANIFLPRRKPSKQFRHSSSSAGAIAQAASESRVRFSGGSAPSADTPAAGDPDRFLNISQFGAFKLTTSTTGFGLSKDRRCITVCNFKFGEFVELPCVNNPVLQFDASGDRLWTLHANGDLQLFNSSTASLEIVAAVRHAETAVLLASHDEAATVDSSDHGLVVKVWASDNAGVPYIIQMAELGESSRELCGGAVVSHLCQFDASSSLILLSSDKGGQLWDISPGMSPRKKSSSRFVGVQDGTSPSTISFSTEHVAVATAETANVWLIETGTPILTPGSGLYLAC